MTRQLSTETQDVTQSAAVLNTMQADGAETGTDDVGGVSDAVAYEQVGLGDYWGTEEAPRQPVVFVGFPRNYKSRADHEGETRGRPGGRVAVRYEEPLGESVPYEEMGLSRFL